MTQATSENPLFDHHAHPRFEEVKPEHTTEAVPVLLEKAKKDFAEFEANIEPTFDGIFERQRMLLEPLGFAWHITGHLMSVRNSDELRKVYEDLQPSVVEFFTSLGNGHFFQALNLFATRHPCLFDDDVEEVLAAAGTPWSSRDYPFLPGIQELIFSTKKNYIFCTVFT